VLQAAAGGLDGKPRNPNAAQAGNPVLFHNDIHWSDRRSSGPIDDGDPADNQPIERTFSLGSGRSFENRATLRLTHTD